MPIERRTPAHTYSCVPHLQAGTIAEAPTQLKFDEAHTFTAGKKTAVSGNTYAMLSQSRFAPHFDFYGPEAPADADHQGDFPVEPRLFPHFVASESASNAGCCPPLSANAKTYAVLGSACRGLVSCVCCVPGVIDPCA